MNQNELQEWEETLLWLRNLRSDQVAEFMIRLRTATIDAPDNQLVNMIDDLLKNKATQ